MEQTSTGSILDSLRNALATRDPQHVTATVDRFDRADVAHVLPELTTDELGSVLLLLGDERVADLIVELDPSQAAQLLLRLTRADAASILQEMEPDDATDVVEEFHPDQAESILIEMDAADAEDIRELLTYPPDTAGGRMTPEYVAVSPDVSADEAITAIRGVAAEAETIYYIYVVDDNDHLLGVISLRDLVLAPPGTPVSETMVADVVKVPADADQEEAAHLVNAYDLLALPVVDSENRLLGIITSDDVADVLEEEVTEDIARIGGTEPLEEPYLQAGVPQIVRKRIGWLLLLFIAEAYTGTVLRHFEGELNEVVALAFFIPLLIGTGGNVGSQTVTTIVRAMAIGEVEFRDILRIIYKELRVGLLLGIAMAGATLIRAWTLGVVFDIGLAVAISASFIVLWAAFVAAALPLILKRLGIDPAVVSAPFITTLVDGTGLFMYFTIARWVLGL